MGAPSLASKRPAATSLPNFSLPPPEVPRAVPDGLPSSGSYGSTSQSSPPGGQSVYYSNHMTGSWPTPGGSQLSGYTYATSDPVTSSTGPLAPPTYSRAPSSYGSATSPSLQHFPSRSASSSASNGESLPAAYSYQDQHAFPSPVAAGAGGGGGGALGSPLASQSPAARQQPGLSQSLLGAPTPSAARSAAPGQNTQGTSGTSQEGASYRPPPTPTSCYPSTSTAQHGSYPSFPSPVTQPSPATSPTASSEPIPRILGPISAMSPPLQFPAGRGHPIPPIGSYASYGPIPGPVLSNMHHPGSPLAMVNGMPGIAGYGHHPGLSPHHGPGLYIHHGNAPAQHADRDRPYKCNECAHAFNRNHDLKRHKRIHMAIKPFPCADCGKRFSRKDALKRHRLVKGCRGASPTEGKGPAPGGPGTTSSKRGDAGIQKRGASPTGIKRA
ncbi:hypothetical protein VTK26DRAFT_3390 [Humicola hyalothermophila]